MDHEVESLLMSDRNDPLTQAKKVVYRLVKKVGFLGILLCASVSLTSLHLCDVCLACCCQYKEDSKLPYILE